MSRCYRRGCVECATKQLLEITQGAAKQAEQQMEGRPEVTDIVEQAARVIGAGRLILRDNGKRNNEKIAQALADAGLLHEPTRTVPTREELVETVSDIDAKSWPNPASTEEIADAVLALLADQPTVNEAKAQALEEFAAHIETTAQRDDVRLTEHAVHDAGGAYLAREQAHEIRDGK